MRLSAQMCVIFRGVGDPPPWNDESSWRPRADETGRVEGADVTKEEIFHPLRAFPSSVFDSTDGQKKCVFLNSHKRTSK